MRFEVPAGQAVTMEAERVRSLAARILANHGLPCEDAESVSAGLVAADVMGVDTHGVSNLLPWYAKLLDAGEINASPRWKIVRDGPSVATIDCDGGLGLIVAPEGMRIAIEKARATGIGYVAMRNGRHLGMAQHVARQALDHQMIGICMTATGPAMLPTHGREPMLGTNPIAVAVPALHEHPFVFDAAMAAVAGNTIATAHRLSATLPPGVLADEAGRPIMEEVPAPPSWKRLLPLGSAPQMGSHKGYGLASIIEILSSVLGGLVVGRELAEGHHNHSVAAIDISHFCDPSEFRQEIDSMIVALRATPPVDPAQPVLVPGQLEWDTQQTRLRDGIPLHVSVVEWMTSEAARTPSALPAARVPVDS